MIRNIIFDMGQVLIRWEPRALLARFDLSEADTQLILTELFSTVEWVQLDHGTISGEQAVRQVCGRLPERLHGVVEEMVFCWWERPLTPIPGMAELVRELKSMGYGIYLLSNASVDLRRYFHRIPGSECFDGLVVSAEERMIKPQHEIYRTVLNRFQLKAEECFFVDDSPLNVEGALCVGISGTIFRGNVTRLRSELRAAEIPVSEGEKR